MRRGLLAIIGILFGAAGAVAEDAPREQVRAVEQLLQRVIEKAEPSLVSVVVSHAKYPPDPNEDGRSAPGKLGRFIPDRPERMWGPRLPNPVTAKLDLSDPHNVADNLYGSGVVLDVAGDVLTNYHLIEGATKIYVRASSGRGCYADIFAADARSDLAVLRLLDTPPGLTAVEIADVRINEGPRREKPNLAKGTWVVALGHPTPGGVADGSPSASWGIVSNLRRRQLGSPREDQRVRPLYQHAILIQTDARVTLGCSGGALFNLDGKLVGLTTPLAAVTGAEMAGGFAIPMDQNYRRIVDALKAGREVEYGFLGVQIQSDPEVRLENGLPLESVAPGTPAWQAGLRGTRQGFREGYDSILAVDGNPIRELDDLFLYVGSALAGTKVTLTVARTGRPPRLVDVTLAKYSHGLPWLATVRPKPVHGLRVEYSSVMPLQWGGQGAPPVGVVVREVEPNSPAEGWLKQLGGEPTRWMITHVNDKPVTTPPEFYEAARRAGPLHLRLIDPNAPPQDRAVREITLP